MGRGMLHIVSLSEARRIAMFQMKAGVENQIAKYRISKHAAFDICDDPCLSKFGTLRRRCPQPADNFRTFVRVPYGHR